RCARSWRPPRRSRAGRCSTTSSGRPRSTPTATSRRPSWAGANARSCTSTPRGCRSSSPPSSSVSATRRPASIWIGSVPSTSRWVAPPRRRSICSVAPSKTESCRGSTPTAMADIARTLLAGVPRGRPVRNPLSLVRVTTAIARTAAGFGVAFMLQSVPAMMEQLPNMHPAWSVTLVGALVLSLALTVVVSIVGRGLRFGHVTFAVVYLVALVSWPFAVLDPAEAPTSSYWLYYTLTIATAMATVGLGIRLATVYVVLAPVLYGVIRVTPAG